MFLSIAILEVAYVFKIFYFFINEMPAFTYTYYNQFYRHTIFMDDS